MPIAQLLLKYGRLKIDRYLAKVWTKVWWHVFIGPQCIGGYLTECAVVKILVLFYTYLPKCTKKCQLNRSRLLL